MEKSCRIRIIREGTEFEAEGDKNFVLEMLDRFEFNTSSNLGSDKTKNKPAVEKTISGKTISVREFILKTGIKRHTDKVLAFGFFLEKYSDLKEFTPGDINNCYYEAKMETSNTSQLIILNIRRGHMMPAKGAKGARKKYTLTHSGEDFIQNKQGKAS